MAKKHSTEDILAELGKFFKLFAGTRGLMREAQCRRRTVSHGIALLSSRFFGGTSHTPLKTKPGRNPKNLYVWRELTLLIAPNNNSKIADITRERANALGQGRQTAGATNHEEQQPIFPSAFFCSMGYVYIYLNICQCK